LIAYGGKQIYLMVNRAAALVNKDYVQILISFVILCARRQSQVSFD
jgi:hypothetical protein